MPLPVLTVLLEDLLKTSFPVGRGGNRVLSKPVVAAAINL